MAESFDTGTHKILMKCLAYSGQKLERCIMIEIQMHCLCQMKEEIMHYEAFTTYDEAFTTYDMREKRK